MLDDMNVLAQRDSEQTLDSTIKQPEQLSIDVEIQHQERAVSGVENIVFVGMGGSALAPEFLLSWTGVSVSVPFEIVKSYELPSYVGKDTLVFVSSCSGNTEEVLSALESARQRTEKIAIITGGGKLAEKASEYGMLHTVLPPIHIQPRMLTFVQVRALVTILGIFEILDATPHLDEMAGTQAWLEGQLASWQKEVTTNENYAKQLAVLSAGKIAEFFGGDFSASAAYKWKISWNENAKNLSYWSKYPEFNHNEFIGWSSHPIEKPFVIFDLTSQFDHERIQTRIELSDRLLSGKRPKAQSIAPVGDTKLQQLLWLHVLADFTSIYLGILNNVDPGPVPLVTKLKQELA